jgi:hypothetical protein
MLNAAQLVPDHQSGKWAEAAQTATDIENCLVSVNKTTPSYKLLYLQEPPSIKSMTLLVRLRLLKIIPNVKYVVNLKMEDVQYLPLSRSCCPMFVVSYI